jgi:hypothetical protein
MKLLLTFSLPAGTFLSTEALAKEEVQAGH